MNTSHAAAALQQSVGRLENMVGWYHSHPGYGCWLSGIDVNTQMTQQQYQDPFLAIVVDPHRTIAAGKVEIGAFRTYPEVQGWTIWLGAACQKLQFCMPVAELNICVKSNNMSSALAVTRRNFFSAEHRLHNAHSTSDHTFCLPT